MTVEEGSGFDLAGSFIDPGADTWNGYATVQGGEPVDLVIGADQTFTVPLDVTQDGQQSIEVCIFDGTVEACADTVVEVQNVAPTMTIDNAPEHWVVLVGDAVQASFTDPGVQDTHSATIEWGDGTTDIVDPASGAMLTARHTYDAEYVVVAVICVTDNAGDQDCAESNIEVLSVGAAVENAIDGLTTDAATDPTVAAAVGYLEGAVGQAQSGALERLEDGDFVAAITKLGAAIDELADAEGDYTSTLLLLAQVAESVARELLDQVGRLALDIGDYSAAVDSFTAAVKKATQLLQ
jgi:hypothetical protein